MAEAVATNLAGDNEALNDRRQQERSYRQKLYYAQRQTGLTGAGAGFRIPSPTSAPREQSRETAEDSGDERQRTGVWNRLRQNIRSRDDAKPDIGGIASAASAIEHMAMARKTKNLITLIGGASSLSGVGIIWTFIQWNSQLIYGNMLKLPGKEFVKLEWYQVGIVLLFDFLIVNLVAVVLVAMLMIAGAIADPNGPACGIIKSIFGDGWVKSALKLAC